jgi:hypothetical protein
MVSSETVCLADEAEMVGFGNSHARFAASRAVLLDEIGETAVVSYSK